LNDGGNSVFVGEDAGLNDDASANQNVGVGRQALYSNTTGTNNSAVGYWALHNNITGSSNTANGGLALLNNITGSSNTANGAAALAGNTTGSSNTAFGNGALYSNTTGVQNIAVGSSAGTYITDGVSLNTVTSNSVFLGYSTKALASSQTNQIVIGYNATGLGSNTAILGNSSITKTRLQGGIEINASDTTITRVSAGRIAVEGVNVVTTSSADTLENKTLTSPTLTTPIIADGAITTAMQKHLQTFEFNGYISSAASTNYFIPISILENKGPFNHNVDAGSNGFTALAPSVFIRTGGKVMPYTGTCKLWKGWVSASGSGAVNISIFKFTPVAEVGSNVALVLVKNFSTTALTNPQLIAINVDGFTVGFNAGDILITGISCVSGQQVYFTSTLEVEWD
jgi:hypothetical protein